ncbi:MAG TPA: pyridoxamine 5'-phosphate oxidase family protein [Candidatus Dormibacteraeota bacterium]|nr:pyridoxamine 5'-phosphate oxidase family protein [Candidatus Dormibacteraeota bacterium]
MSERTRLRRLPERGSHDWPVIAAILDEALVCHVAFAAADGAGPVVIPTAHARAGRVLYLHGAPASRMLRTVGGGVDVCVAVTLLDGLVLARSLFHHSLNYRSVVAFGRATEVVDLDEKRRALLAFAEHVLRGRAAEVREPSAGELKATRVLALDLSDASAKLRTGPPVDDEDDLDLPVWAGVLPVALGIGPVVAETPRLAVPVSVRQAACDPRFAGRRFEDAATPVENSA